MKKAAKKTIVRAAPTAHVHEHHDPLSSPVIRLGIVFVILAALALMYYAGQKSVMVPMMQ